MNKLLLIGGTDPSGAGLQTDWKVTNTLEIDALSVVTAVTAQNNNGVLSYGILPYSQIKAQFDALGDAHFSAIKIGMLGNEQVIKAVINFLSKQTNKTVVILDPILSASSGAKLLNYAGQRLLLSKLMPYITLLTPNIDELSSLSNMNINNYSDIEIASQKLIKSGVQSILVKGGHFPSQNGNENINKSIDTFINPTGVFFLQGSRWENKQNVRGTGCVLASAIASSVCQGYSLVDALILGKALVSQGIKHAIPSSTKQAYKFQFTQQYTGRNFSLKHVPSLTFNASDTRFHFSPCDFPKFSATPSPKALGIYPVVDSVDWLKKLIPLGVETIQLRIKEKTNDAVEADIIEAIHLCKTHETRLFINDYWQLAIDHKAYGIHLGQEDLASLTTNDLQAIADSGCRLGISTHSYTEVARTIAINPSYIALGPIFATTSKDMPWIPQGVDAVANWVKLLGNDYPLVAIGGINFERAEALKKTGVGSVAMISAITESRDYKKTTEGLLALWEDH